MSSEAAHDRGRHVPGGYRFESIPDGISIGKTNGNGTVDIYVNHETSLVPFPTSDPDRGRPGDDFVNSHRLESCASTRTALGS